MKNSIVKHSNVESSSCSPVAAPKKKIRQSAGSTKIENVAMHFPLQCIFVKFAYCCAGGPSFSCEMIILRNNGHGGIIRVCMGIFTTALRNKKNTSNSQKKKYLTLLPQRIACYLTAYFDEKNAFLRVVHFEVFNVHYLRKTQG